MQAHHMLGMHPVVRAIGDAAERLACSRTAVAVVGERGTGKDLFVRHLHASSGRGEEALVRIDCAEGAVERLENELFERDGGWRRASGGTLQLDDLSSLPLDLQARLLETLCAAAAAGPTTLPQIVVTLASEVAVELRADRLAAPLVAHLQPVEIVLPALRQRRADIPVLVQHFLALYAHRHGVGERRIETEALVHLWQYDWPGNVRELESVIERIVVLCPRAVIRPSDLPDALRATAATRPTKPPSPPQAVNGPNLRATL